MGLLSEYHRDNGLSDEDKAMQFCQKYENTYQNFTINSLKLILLQVAVMGTTSNAQPERFFSRTTWLTRARRSSTQADLLRAYVTIRCNVF